MRFKYIFALLFSFLNSCSNDSGSSGGTSSATVSVRVNQGITGYPHAIDMYIPSNAESAIIFLHGGGGKKEGIESDLGIKNDTTTTNYDVSSTGQAWLISQKVMAIFPQGQTNTGTAGAWTWNNYVMDSGQNDVAFLQALVASIKADSTFSKVTKFYLVGHSNGGMMANRMWCESPATFDAYGSMAGPPSTMLAAAGSHPCTPTVAKPYIGIVGDSDTVLQSTGNMSAATWTCSLYNGSSAAWVSATMINEKLYHAIRVTKKCSGSVASPTVLGNITTYSDCSDSVKMMVVAQSASVGGDHCLARLSGPCVTTLAGATGLDYKTTLFNFLKNF